VLNAGAALANGTRTGSFVVIDPGGR
jgi:hypothetical protein